MSGSISILPTRDLHRDIFDLISGLVLCSLQRGWGERQTLLVVIVTKQNISLRAEFLVCNYL